MPGRLHRSGVGHLRGAGRAASVSEGVTTARRPRRSTAPEGHARPLRRRVKVAAAGRRCLLVPRPRDDDRNGLTNDPVMARHQQRRLQDNGGDREADDDSVTSRDGGHEGWRPPLVETQPAQQEGEHGRSSRRSTPRPRGQRHSGCDQQIVFPQPDGKTPALQPLPDDHQEADGCQIDRSNLRCAARGGRLHQAARLTSERQGSDDKEVAWLPELPPEATINGERAPAPACASSS